MNTNGSCKLNNFSYTSSGRRSVSSMVLPNLYHLYFLRRCYATLVQRSHEKNMRVTLSYKSYVISFTLDAGVLLLGLW
jgi:hypothetical protein